MPVPLALSLSDSIDQAYYEARNLHGDLQLSPEEFEASVRQIIEQHHEYRRGNASALSVFRTLQTSDLYLSIACSLGRNAAWRRFLALYNAYIRRVARSCCSKPQEARDVADNLLAHLYMDSGSGRSRIASYNGDGPLQAWLGVVIKNRAINHRKLRSNNYESLDGITEAIDTISKISIEANVGADERAARITDSLRLAFARLSTRQRLLLALTYVDLLDVTQTARVFGVHPCTISRQIERAHVTLGKLVISSLRSRFRLPAVAISEYVAALTEHPEDVILESLSEILEESFRSDIEEVIPGANNLREFRAHRRVSA